jgi:uncharacterized repeat protein (TIGR03837 family)
MSLLMVDSELLPMKPWDIFCRVIDNFGDIGVCWRLACELAQRGQRVRLWVDDASALAWMAPGGCAGVQVMPWQPEQLMPQDVQPGDVVIEAFGCDAPHAWMARADGAWAHANTYAHESPPAASPVDYAITINSIANYSINTGAIGLKASQKPLWINLEYLSAEPYAQRSHRLPSPVMSGPAQGMTKWFFYPGFTAGTGGLIREQRLFQPPSSSPVSAPARRISLFCYEPPALQELLRHLAASPQPCELLVTAGRTQRAVEAFLDGKNGTSPRYLLSSLLSINELPFMPQAAYDALLQSCDLNFVRGEDSLVRAIWAGRAFIWQIYPQQDGAHAAKLEAFLDWLQAPPDLRQYHRIWNGLQPGSLPQLDIATWTACAQAARARLLVQTDLVTQLLDFVEEKANFTTPPGGSRPEFGLKS